MLPVFPRTHFNNTPRRAMSQFLGELGATTTVYPKVLRGGVDAVIQEIGHIPMGCGHFTASLRCALGDVALATISSARLALQRNGTQRDVGVLLK